MNRHSILFACALVLAVVTSVAAQQVITGTVARVDPAAGTVVLDDGRMFLTTGEVMVDDRPMPLASLRPGTRVTLRETGPVTLQSGRYVVRAEPAPAEPVVMAPPPPGVVVAPQPVVVREDPIVGTVARVDVAEGEIILTDHRVVQVTPFDVVLVNNQPMPLGSIPIGSTVVIRGDTPYSALPGRDQDRDHTGADIQAP
jgi:hypothetical protein